MCESELLYRHYYLQAEGSVPIKEYHRWTIQHMHTNQPTIGSVKYLVLQSPEKSFLL